jgi:predicted CXXCH cytochrome family protein
MGENMKIKIITLVIVVGVLFLSVFSAMSASVVGSRHDLSSPYGGNDGPCVYCHTPHYANSGQLTSGPNLASVPLWNRGSGNVTYTMYTSPTIDTTIAGTPSPITLACMGCHDGVLSRLGDAGNSNDTKHGVINAPGSGGIPDLSTYPNCQRCHPEMYGGTHINWIGTDLRKSHPVSMSYPTVEQDPGFFIPPSLQKGWSDVPLYSGKVECPTCHNVHDPSKTPFLRISNSGSGLCYKCHNK